MCSHLDDMPKELLKPGQRFRDIPQWSSIQALVFIAFINHDYNVAISHEELSKAETFQDIFDLIKAKS
jgi:acyl carrier protein